MSEKKLYNFADVLPSMMINLDFHPGFILPADQKEVMLNGCEIRFIDAEDSVLVATEYLDKELFAKSLTDEMHIKLDSAGVVKVDHENMIIGMLLTYESSKKYHHLLNNNGIPHKYFIDEVEQLQGPK